MDDPFPPSLPRLSSPRIYDSSLGETMEGIDGTHFEETFGQPGDLLLDEVMNDSGYAPTAVKTSNDTPSNPSHSANHDWPESPESSPSSDGSNQHGRKNSNESSATGDISMAATPVAQRIFIEADPAPEPVTEEEACNQFMNSAFDFESASSSPVPTPTTNISLQKPENNSINIPMRGVPAVRAANRSISGSTNSSSSPEMGLSMFYKHGQRSHQQLGQSCSPNELVKQDLDTGRFGFSQNFVLNANNPAWAGHNLAANSPMPVYQQPRVPMPYASPRSPQLHVSNFMLKSRVETQHILKYTLDPLPPGIKRLHLQPYTISKPKFMTKPPPSRSPDMLEMFATVVSSSAMEDPSKRERALARARGALNDLEEHHVTPSNDPDSTQKDSNDTTLDEDGKKPANGGPVQICKGCMERELKRADRKKMTDPKEQEEWKTLAAQRVVVFNVQEVRDWQQTSPFTQKNSAGKEKVPPVAHYDLLPRFSPSAMQVDIPTRITCYCRHHEEKVGFRIIFTIRDHQDNVVAQTISNSIMITDDHKTSGGPSTLQDVHMVPPPQVPHFQSTPFTMGPVNNHLNARLSRNAYSSSDLSRLKQPSHPGSSYGMGSYPMTQEVSGAPSATMTPRNLSRPASPTIPTSQQAKRRKGSGSTRIRNELAMTAMTTKFPNSPITPPSSAPSTSMSPGMYYPGHPGTSNFSPNYTEPTGLTFPQTTMQYPSTIPPRTMNTTFSPPVTWNQGQRSQSMENLIYNGNSTPSSATPSRVPSPHMVNGNPESETPDIIDPRSFVEQTAEARAAVRRRARVLPTSLNSINTTSNLTQSPILRKITPSEGPIAGGTEVSCLGAGFYPGLEIMFGDAPATITTFWGDNVLVCQTPPALHAGVVAVTFRHHYDQRVDLPPEQQQSFKYINNDNMELMQMMYTLVSRNLDIDRNGSSDKGTTKDEAINIVANQMITTGGNQLSTTQLLRDIGNIEQHLLTPPTSMSKADTEAFLMQCLEQMDLDERHGQANLNLQGRNGQTLLHFAASLGYYRVTAGLLTRGAHPDIGDRNGMSPLHLASLHGHIRIIRKLRAAGSDPTLRSLNGFAPTDMTNCEEIQDAINAIDPRSRSQSAAATPATGLSRAPSVHSQASSGDGYRSRQLKHAPITQGGDFERFASHSISAAQLRHRSRCNSSKSQDHQTGDITRPVVNPNASQLETQSALTAWRDQLSLQIQHFQETVHRALPPLPNLPNYQYYPVVRRISSLVPQRHTPLVASPEIQNVEKEGQYGWLELVLGPREPPPPYGDLPPHKPQEILQNDNAPRESKAMGDLSAPPDAKAPLVRAALESFVDQKCETVFDSPDHPESSSDMGTINIGSKGLTQQEQDRVRSAYAKKVKKLRKDRNFLFIWLPLFILFLLVALKDGASHVAYITGMARSFYQNRLGDRVVEEVA